METPTVYTDSRGKETLISELNGIHLINALVKLSSIITTDENHAMREALKDEAIRRLYELENKAPTPTQE